MIPCIRSNIGTEAAKLFCDDCVITMIREMAGEKEAAPASASKATRAQMGCYGVLELPIG